jgi:hypothetical protein
MAGGASGFAISHRPIQMENKGWQDSKETESTMGVQGDNIVDYCIVCFDVLVRVVLPWPCTVYNYVLRCTIGHIYVYCVLLAYPEDRLLCLALCCTSKRRAGK